MRAVYASARRQGLTDAMLEALPDYRASDLFTPSEKSALHFADMMAGDHKRIGDELFDELRHYYSEAEILELGWRIAIFVGYGRLVYAVGLEDVGKLCPLSFTHADAAATAE